MNEYTYEEEAEFERVFAAGNRIEHQLHALSKELSNPEATTDSVRKAKNRVYDAFYNAYLLVEDK